MTASQTAATTPDEHLAVLRELMQSLLDNGEFRRAAALAWILDETAYGVDAAELVL